MAKLEKTIRGNFDMILQTLENAVLQGSMSASYEDGSDFSQGDFRCSVRVYERYSYSGGNRVSMAVTLAHDAKLLLLDEPTSGLDPVGRDEMLYIFRDYMVKEDRTIFFSTHITSDLEKIADYITYIQNGRILYSGLKDDLIEKYCLVRGGIGDLPQSKHKQIFGLREHPSGFDGMIETKNIAGFPTSVVTETVSLDDIMVRMSKGVQE